MARVASACKTAVRTLNLRCLRARQGLLAQEARQCHQIAGLRTPRTSEKRIMNLAHVRSELKKRPKPLRWLVSRVLLRTRLCYIFLVHAHGYRLRFHPSELSADLWYNRKCRNEDIQFLKSYLKLGDWYVDVGANIGIWVLAAGMAVGSPGRVIAFEPHPRTFGFLRRNVALNRLSNVELHNCAVGEGAATVCFSDVKSDDTNRVLHANGGIRVPMVTLNSALEEDRAVALLKIDAEGYEKFVLNGAGLVIDKIQCIFIEISQKDLEMHGCSPNDVLTWLEERGYTLYGIASSSTLRKVTAESMLKMGEIPVMNLVALRSSGEFARRTGWTITE